ncbi:hypothetical protein ACLOJK_032065 [Asimina triloba]
MASSAASHPGYSSLPYRSSPQVTSRVELPSGEAEQKGLWAVGTRRLWLEFLNPRAFGRPYSCGEAAARIGRNLAHFRANYAVIFLLVLFFSLICHPVSIIVFLVVFVAWIFCYLSRDEPIAIFNRRVDDRVVPVALGAVTTVALVFTHVWLNVLVAMVIGTAVAALHAAFRGTEDQFLDEREAVDGGLISVASSRSADQKHGRV